jgi:hypothetical protein
VVEFCGVRERREGRSKGGIYKKELVLKTEGFPGSSQTGNQPPKAECVYKPTEWPGTILPLGDVLHSWITASTSTGRIMMQVFFFSPHMRSGAEGSRADRPASRAGETFLISAAGSMDEGGATMRIVVGWNLGIGSAVLVWFTYISI